MKKIVMLFAAAAMTVSAAFAQDINAVTDTFNNAGMELNMGNKEAALTEYQSALAEAEALGADAVINIRYASSAVMQNAAEVIVYGTAVKFVNK